MHIRCPHSLDIVLCVSLATSQERPFIVVQAYSYTAAKNSLVSTTVHAQLICDDNHTQPKIEGNFFFKVTSLSSM